MILYLRYFKNDEQFVFESLYIVSYSVAALYGGWVDLKKTSAQ